MGRNGKPAEPEPDPDWLECALRIARQRLARVSDPRTRFVRALAVALLEVARKDQAGE